MAWVNGGKRWVGDDKGIFVFINLISDVYNSFEVVFTRSFLSISKTLNKIKSTM